MPQPKTEDEMKKEAEERVKANSPEGSTNFKPSKVYENILDGTLVQVKFEQPARKEDSSYVLFVRDEIRFFRWSTDVIDAISRTKERNFFFRFYGLAGTDGVIALILVVIFSSLLCVLAFHEQNSTNLLELVKTCFTIILGYFFGSQATKKSL